MPNDASIQNNRTIAKADKKYWLELESVLNSAFDELKLGDKIRTNYSDTDRKNLRLLLQTMVSIDKVSIH